MKNIFSNDPTFIVELSLKDVEQTPENLQKLDAQRKEEEEYNFQQYCDTQGYLAKIGQFSSNVTRGVMPNNYIQCQVILKSGPERIGHRSFHYPLVVKTINTKDPVSHFTASRPFYPDTPVGIGQAQSEAVWDLRSQLSEYDIQKGYRIHLNTNYKGETKQQEFGPFYTPFNKSDNETDPTYLLKSLYWGINGSVAQVADYIKDKEQPIAGREKLKKAMKEFYIFAEKNKPNFSEGFLFALKENAPELLGPDASSEASVQTVQPTTTLNQSKIPQQQLTLPHNGTLPKSRVHNETQAKI